MSALLLLALSINAFVSCNNENTVIQADDSSDDTTVQIEKKYDFEEAEFRIIGSNGALNNYPDEELTGDIINDTLTERDRIVSEKLNVKFKYTVAGDDEVATLVKNSVLAQENEYDMLAGTAISLSKLGVNDVLLDILSVDTINTTSSEWSTLVAEGCQANGKLFFLSGDILPAFYTMPGCIFMNCDVASEYKITKDDVYKVIDSGKWTIDQLAAYTKNTCSDIDDSGSISSANDFIGYLSLKGELAAGVLAVGAGIHLCDATKNGIKVDLMNERTLELIDKAQILFGEYTVDAESDNLHKAFRENRVIFTQHYTSSAFTRYRDVEADFAILPMPKLNEKQESYYSMLNPWGTAFIAFPNYADTEYVGVVSQCMAEYSYENLRPAVYESSFKVKGARDDESAKMLDLIFDNLYIDNNSIYNFGGSMTALSNSLFDGKEFSSAYASIESKIEADIETLFKTE